MPENYYKIVSFDMDGTLIPNTTSTLHYAGLLGVRREVEVLEGDFVNGLLDSTGFMQKISQIMKGLSLSFIKENLATLPVINGIEETVKKLKENGVITVIVTTSAKVYAEALKEKYGFDIVYGTEFIIDDNGYLKEGVKVCSSADKIRFIRELAKNNHIGMNQVAAIGDSISDIPLFSQVGETIAINYNEKMKGKANYYLKTTNITDILNIVLSTKKNESIKKIVSGEDFGFKSKNDFSKIYYINSLKDLSSYDLCTQLINDFDRSSDIILNSNLFFKILPDDFNRINANLLNQPLIYRQYKVLAEKIKHNEKMMSHIGVSGINAINDSIEYYINQESKEASLSDLLLISNTQSLRSKM